MPLDPDRYRPDPLHPTLGESFFAPVVAARFPARVLRYRNQRWAARVGLDRLDPEEWERHFARFEPLPGNLERPLALAYHGHQFRVYNPGLGDGRGFLFAQLRDAVDGRLLDLGTKGSGETPWSRGGDGRLTLKGGVREVLATTLLEALGVYTSKSLSLFETGEALERGDEPSPTRSSVLVRLSHSHVRFGTFQRLAYLGETDAIRRLVEYSVAHYLPEAADAPDLPVAFLRAVVDRSARLAASWTVAGFVHGVLNSDNMVVTGESFDYGPWRFLPICDPDFVAAYFDHNGLYRFGRQPDAVLWNLHRLADALATITPAATLAPALDAYGPAFRAALQARLLVRLGVSSVGPDDDAMLVESFFETLGATGVGFERCCFDWWGGEASAVRAAASPAANAYGEPRFVAFRRRLESHPPRDPGRLAHPYFARSGPCTLLVDDVERLWAPIAADDDWSSFEGCLREIDAMRDALTIAAPTSE